jgi:hypothetical protein
MARPLGAESAAKKILAALAIAGGATAESVDALVEKHPEWKAGVTSAKATLGSTSSTRPAAAGSGSARLTR